jgi:cobalamin synthase
MRRLGPLYGGAVALVHSTPWRWPETIGDEARSSFWVVVVGVPIAVVAWIAAAVLHAAGVPPGIDAVVGLAVLSLASAALVERGVVERIERRPDAIGVTSLLVIVFATLVRAAAITTVPATNWFGVLLATVLVGRWSAVFLQALGDPIIHDDAERSLVAMPSPPWLTAALGVGVAVITVIALGKAGIVALALTAAIAFGLGLDAQRRDHGLSPPVVALAAAVGELVVLLVATIR